MQRALLIHQSLVRAFLLTIIVAGFPKALSSKIFHPLMSSCRSTVQPRIVSENHRHSLIPSDVANIFQSREIGGKVDIDDGVVVALRGNLLVWYLKNRRLLPWRGDVTKTVTLMVTDAVQGSSPSSDKGTSSADMKNGFKSTSKNHGRKKIGSKTTTNDKDEDEPTFTDIPITPPPMSAYGTWISEIMLQQTRVETVIPYWLKWMKKFPTVQDLASATGDDVNALWAGLGYYRRAQMLLKGAKRVVEVFEGRIPSTVIELKKIDGIGPYTAGAIASIAFNQVEPLVDGNVIRVLSRLYALKETIGSKSMEKVSWSLAEILVDPGSPGDFNQALMELGATVCKPTSPNCPQCPVADLCRARILVDYSCKNTETKNRHDESREIEENIENNVDDNSTKKMKILSNRKALKSKITLKYDDASETENENGMIQSSELNSRGYPNCISYFPQKMKKKEPKEIHLYVTVFVKRYSITEKTKCGKIKNEKDEIMNKKQKKIIDEGIMPESKFLFLRRPDKKGLLANQWEFPNIVIIPKKSFLPTNNSENMDENDNESENESGYSAVEKNGKRCDVKKGRKKTFKINEVDDTDDVNDDDGYHVSAAQNFLRGTLGVDWIPHSTVSDDEKNKFVFSGSNLSATSSSSTSSTTSSSSLSRISALKNNVEKGIGTDKKVGEGHGVEEITELESSTEVKEENIDIVTVKRKRSDFIDFKRQDNDTATTINSNTNSKYRLFSSTPSVSLQPIIHIFSHQKHVMHVSLNEIYQTDGQAEDSWESFCGEKREIRWMTKDEIMTAGITTGCKKILLDSLKQLE